MSLASLVAFRNNFSKAAISLGYRIFTKIFDNSNTHLGAGTALDIVVYALARKTKSVNTKA